jgi:hypothetical protein
MTEWSTKFLFIFCVFWSNKNANWRQLVHHILAYTVSSSRSLNTTVRRLSRFCHKGKSGLLCRAHTVTRLKMNIISYHWLPRSALFNMHSVVFQQTLNILTATRECDSGVTGDDKGGTVSLEVTNLILSLFLSSHLWKLAHWGNGFEVTYCSGSQHSSGPIR